LTDYLTFACDRPGEILRPTSIPGVDHIGTGLADAPSDLLATRRMKELIEFLRGRYTMVIVLGPAVAERVDLEILAAQANGIVLLLQAARHREAALRRFLDSMRELKAPLLGSVVCS
jgi:Mrp family chromosome partitioning ATPase